MYPFWMPRPPVSRRPMSGPPLPIPARTFAFESYISSFGDVAQILDVEAFVMANTPTGAVVTELGLGSGDSDQPAVTMHSVKVGTAGKLKIGIDGGIHPTEYAAAYYPLMVTHRVQNPSGPNQALWQFIKDNAEVDCIPVLCGAGMEGPGGGTYKAPELESAGGAVQLNRNFDIHWQEYVSANPTTAGNPAHSEYAGNAPFSNPETRAVRDQFADVHFYINCHTQGNVNEVAIDSNAAVGGPWQTVASRAYAYLEAVVAASGHPTYVADTYNVSYYVTATAWHAHQSVKGKPRGSQIIEPGAAFDATYAPKPLNYRAEWGMTAALILMVTAIDQWHNWGVYR